jgi:hypothetical protein
LWNNHISVVCRIDAPIQPVVCGWQRGKRLRSQVSGSGSSSREVPPIPVIKEATDSDSRPIVEGCPRRRSNVCDSCHALEITRDNNQLSPRCQLPRGLLEPVRAPVDATALQLRAAPPVGPPSSPIETISTAIPCRQQWQPHASSQLTQHGFSPGSTQP